MLTEQKLAAARLRERIIEECAGLTINDTNTGVIIEGFIPTVKLPNGDVILGGPVHLESKENPHPRRRYRSSAGRTVVTWTGNRGTKLPLSGFHAQALGERYLLPLTEIQRKQSPRVKA